MIASQRFEKIIELVNERGIINIKELSKILNVSEMTIRRDSEELEKQGKLIKVHGGVKKVSQKEVVSNNDEKEMKERTENYEKKDLVCQKAASFIKTGDCVFLDGGTTVAPIIKYLQDKKIKIVTNSLLIANSFYSSNAELFLIGGKYITEYNMNVGAISLSTLNNFNFDYAFLGCAGLDLERGVVYTTEMDTMLIKEKAMQLSENKYLLVDDSKLSIKGFYTFIETGKFDAVICNNFSNMGIEFPENFILVDKNEKSM